MLSFNAVLNQLSLLEKIDNNVSLMVQSEAGPQLTAIVASRFYHSDEEIGKAVKSLLTDCINNQLFYEDVV